MRLKTGLFLVFLMVLGIIISSYFVGSILTANVISPFSTIQNPQQTRNPEGIATVTTRGDADVSFVNADIQTQWIPWVIKQASILIGAVSLVVFIYAGITLIIRGDNEEQLGKSMKMIIYGIVGIALAGFSYTIIANVLVLF